MKEKTRKKNKMISFFDEWKRLSQKQNLVKRYFWWIILVAYLLFYVSYIYTDILYTTYSGVNLWNSLFSGNILRYHSYAANPLYSSPLHPGMSQSPYSIYPFPLYLVFAIWDFPLWVADRFFGVNIFESLLCLLWIKAMLIGFLICTVAAFLKICSNMQMEERYHIPAVFLFVSSIFVLSPILQQTQYDIIALCFILWGMVYFMQGDQKNTGIFWAIAITMKMFALLVIIPILLLYEKRILRFIYKIFIICTPTLLSYIFMRYSTVSSLTETTSYTSNIFSSMFFKGNIHTGADNIFILPAAYMFVCIYCYFQNTDSILKNSTLTIFACLLSMGVFFLFAPAYPYWIILLAPYPVLLCFMNTDRFKINIWLTIIFSAALSFWQISNFFWCYEASRMDYMLPSILWGNSINHDFNMNVIDVIARIPVSFSFFFTVFFVTLVAFIYINRPGVEVKNDERPEMYGSLYLALNASISIGIMALPLLLQFYSYLRYGLIQ